MKKLMFIVVLLIASVSLFSQEYEIAWEKDIGGSYAQFSKDGEFIYVAGGNTISKYRSSDGSFVSKFDNSGVPKATEIYGMSISKNDKYLITWLGDTPGNHNLYDLTTGKAIKQLSGFYWCDFWHDDEKLICIKDYEKCNIVSIIDVNSGKEIKTNTSINRQEIIKVSHNGKMFATASIYTDSQKNKKFYLTLWNTDSLSEIKRFELEAPDNQTDFKEIKFSWDDKFVAVRTFYPHHVNIYDTQKFELILNSNQIKQQGCFDFEFTLNNELFLFYGDVKLHLIKNDFKSNIQIFDLMARPLSINLNNKLFTGNALLSPKPVGVTENNNSKTQIKISTLKNTIIIENNSIPIDTPSIKIIDLKGNILFNIKQPINTGTNRITLPNTIINGIYLIQFESKNLNFSQKILIEG
jgi:hypothetical protein